ncbi:hypothetical protein DH2020_035488 [Rehmannia glutinosa]|uniref:Symplekin n=1 Tax=Rehmannia glutinosa TaxID=99300 RepID=A0ABR0V7H6_REHGL
MAGPPSREQALSLLAAANNHGNLTVKLSSLKQAKDILLSVEPSQAAELFPYLVELQYSPEILVRKYLLEVIDEIGAKTREHLSILLPVLLTYLKDSNPVIAKQTIITGTKIFCIFQRRGIVERWLEELWTWMIKFRDAVLGIIFEAGSVGSKLLAIKFLETYVLQFTLDSNGFGSNPEGLFTILYAFEILIVNLYISDSALPAVMIRPGRVFNVSWIMDGHPVLDPPALVSDANRYLGILLDMLRSANNFPGSLTITAVNRLKQENVHAVQLFNVELNGSLPENAEMVVQIRECSNLKLDLGKFLEGAGESDYTHPMDVEPCLDIAFVVFSECCFSLSQLKICDVATQLQFLPNAHVGIVVRQDNVLTAVFWAQYGDMVPDYQQVLGGMCPLWPFLVILLCLKAEIAMSFIVVCLAAIARKRPVYYKSVLTALLDFSPNLETAKGRHTVSIQYSLRTAFLGFLRCTHPVITEDDQLSSQLHISGDVTKKRSAPLDNEDQNNSFDSTSKRFRLGPTNNTTATVDNSDAGQDHVNGISPKLPGDLTPVEQMIAMIGALIAEGERGVESLEILISNIHADLLADIVITNMKHLPKNPPPLTRHNNLSLNHPSDSSCDPSQVVASNGFATSTQTSDHSAQVPASSSNMTSLPFSDIMSPSANLSADSKRDPRRDPRRLDPRRMVVPVDVPPTPIVEDNANSIQHPALQSDFDVSISSSPPVLLPPPSISESTSQLLMPTTQPDLILPESPETNNDLHLSPSPINKVEDAVVLDVAMLDEAYSSSSQEADQLSPDISNVDASEIASAELPVLPMYIELAEDHQRNARRMALERIFNSYQNSQRTDFKQTQIALVARLFAQIDVNDVIGMVQKRIGHELVLHILYHLHSLVISDSASSAAAVYEKFLLGVAKSLLGDLPASDKSFSRLLGEVPCIPDSVLGLLDDICTKRHSGADARDGDRVTQGLGAVWSLILGRPLCRQACLDIALKCTTHPEDDVRAKAIRLVSNKLYMISYISEKIEQFATDKFLSAVDQRFSDSFSPSTDSEKRIGGEVESAETSISGSQVSDLGISENDAVKGVQDASLNDSSNIFSQAHSLMSLFFALCTKKPILLQLVFDNYARAPKAVKQAVHRHIAVLMRALGSSYSELLLIISNPPHGSEDLLIQVLHLLCEGQTPPPDLVATVKHLYETRLKDAAILIPIISAFSKDEVLSCILFSQCVIDHLNLIYYSDALQELEIVLPIFPRFVQLPLQKFQMALAHILQGSAHTGPALTPAEVLVAIHDISPERDGLPLKKIPVAPLFLSRMFAQLVLSSVRFYATSPGEGIKPDGACDLHAMPPVAGLGPGRSPELAEDRGGSGQFCHGNSVQTCEQAGMENAKTMGWLLEMYISNATTFLPSILPSPQLESALNKYPSLRGPLTAFVNQSSVKASLPRSTLAVLGLASETDMQQRHVSSSLHVSDPTSSIHGATST